MILKSSDTLDFKATCMNTTTSTITNLVADTASNPVTSSIPAYTPVSRTFTLVDVSPMSLVPSIKPTSELYVMRTGGGNGFCELPITASISNFEYDYNT